MSNPANKMSRTLHALSIAADHVEFELSRGRSLEDIADSVGFPTYPASLWSILALLAAHMDVISPNRTDTGFAA
jgi:hypothetical protein